MKFVLDNTVGKLARLLRIAGFDTSYVVENDLPQVIAISREQQRLIVSRNSRYEKLALAADFYHVESDDPEEQFLALLSDLNLDLEENLWLSRCLECNALLERVDKQATSGKVWPYVWATQEKFYHCPDCDKLFWSATHVAAMREKLLELKSELDRRRRPGEP